MDKIVWNRQTMIFWFKIGGKNDAIQCLEVDITQKIEILETIADDW